MSAIIAAVTSLAVLLLLLAARVHHAHRERDEAVRKLLKLAVGLLLLGAALGLAYWLAPGVLPA